MDDLIQASFKQREDALGHLKQLKENFMSHAKDLIKCTGLDENEPSGKSTENKAF